MDRKQLERKLPEFKSFCAKKGYPIADISLEEAYPAVSDTSYFILIKAAWTTKLGYSASLDVLLDVLWEVFNVESRKKVFGFKILDKDDNMNALSLQKERYA